MMIERLILGAYLSGVLLTSALFLAGIGFVLLKYKVFIFEEGRDESNLQQ